METKNDRYQGLKLTGRYEYFWNIIKTREISDIIKSAGILYNYENNRFELKYLNQQLLVDINKFVIKSCDDTKIEYELGLAVLTYLAVAKDIPLSNDWITVHQLSVGNLFFRGVHSLPTDEIEQLLSSAETNIGKLNIGFSGIEIKTTADFCYEYKLLPKVPMRLLYWKKDAEFPARVSLLFDRMVEKYLLLDGILALVNVFTKRLKKYINGKMYL